MRRIEIFRAGTHVDAHGRTLTFTEADLDATARAYDPAVHEAPIVIGHPRHDAPAYGWVGRLERRGDRLDAEPRQVDAQFAELVRHGRYKRVSASFYLPDSPANPRPGVYYLRHVGVLGAQPPAVKGLPPVELAEAEEGVVEFSDWADRENAALWRRLREWILARFGAEDADRAVPGYAVDGMEEAARGAPAEEPVYHEEEPMKTITMTEAEFQERLSAAVAEALRAREAEFAEREQALAQKEAEHRRAEIGRWFDGLVAQGKALPAWRDEGFLAFVEAVDRLAEPVEFAEGRTETPGAWLRRWVEQLGRHPLFRQMARPEGEPDQTSFAEADDALAQKIVAAVQPATPSNKE